MNLQVKTDGLTGESLKFAEAFNQALKDMPEGISQKQFDDALENIKKDFPKDVVTKADVTKEVDALKEILAEQGKALNTFKVNNGNRPMTMKDAIRAELEKPEMKTQLAKLKSGEIRSLPEFIINKAAITMTEAASLGVSNTYVPQPQFLPGLVPLVRNRPFLREYIGAKQAASARIVWSNKYNPQGTCAFIAEGAVKPLISFEIKTESSDAKKIADKIKVSNEMLDDIPYMASEINGELKYQVDIKTDTAILSGAGGDSISGISTYASAFVLSTLSTTNPTNSDALLAARTQLSSLNFYANYAFINPIDAGNMQLAKAVDSGVYLLPPYTTQDGMRMGAMLVVEENQIPVGSMLVMDSTKANLYMWEDFYIRIGYVNDDFEKNLVTIIGEQRLHFFIPTNYVNGFLYDTFTNVKAAIATV